jgi:hypothetical protein
MLQTNGESADKYYNSSEEHRNMIPIKHDHTRKKINRKGAKNAKNCTLCFLSASAVKNYTAVKTLFNIPPILVILNRLQ